MAIPGRKAQLRVSGPPVPFSGEATTANGARTQYQITDPSRRVLDQATAVTVSSSATGAPPYTLVPAASYTVNRLSGTVTFAAAQAAGTSVIVGGGFLPLAVAAEAKEFSYTLSSANLEAPRFGDGFLQRLPGLKDATGSLSMWTTADRTFEESLVDDTPLVLDMYSDASAVTPDLRAWVRVSKNEMKAAIDGLIETSVEWEGAPDADGRSVSVA